MSVSRITSRFSRTVLNQCRNSVPPLGGRDRRYVSTISNQLIAPYGTTRDKAVSPHISLLHHSALNLSPFQWFRFSSSPQQNEKNTAQSGNEQENNKSDKDTSAPTNDTPDEKAKEKGRKSTKRTEFSDSDSDSDMEFSDLSREDLVKLVVEKEQLLTTKQEELEKMKDKVLRTFAEMENIKDRTRRESENAKKFAIQNFAKSLLDVADNMGRASTAAKGSFSKVDASTDAAAVIQQLKILLEGVEMTEKQLADIFKKFGLERYEPMDEEFDPNRHNAVFQVPDASKPADRVAVVLKAGYILHDRVIRPAEVGVTVAVNNEETEKDPKA